MKLFPREIGRNRIVQHRWIEKRPKAALYFGQGPKFFPQVLKG